LFCAATIAASIAEHAVVLFYLIHRKLIIIITIYNSNSCIAILIALLGGLSLGRARLLLNPLIDTALNDSI
jgi:hypothetical protein